jgi:flagellar motor switch protein FliM
MNKPTKKKPQGLFISGSGNKKQRSVKSRFVPMTKITTGYNSKIKIYDFKRPDIFSKDNTRAASIMCENFTRRFVSELREEDIKQIKMHVASVDQLTVEEFFRSIPTPTFIMIFKHKSNYVYVEIDNPATFTFLNILFSKMEYEYK